VDAGHRPRQRSRTKLLQARIMRVKNTANVAKFNRQQ